jgi:hypothetical protein
MRCARVVDVKSAQKPFDIYIYIITAVQNNPDSGYWVVDFR